MDIKKLIFAATIATMVMFSGPVAAAAENFQSQELDARTKHQLYLLSKVAFEALGAKVPYCGDPKEKVHCRALFAVKFPTIGHGTKRIILTYAYAYYQAKGLMKDLRIMGMKDANLEEFLIKISHYVEGSGRQNIPVNIQTLAIMYGTRMLAGFPVEFVSVQVKFSSR